MALQISSFSLSAVASTLLATFATLLVSNAIVRIAHADTVDYMTEKDLVSELAMVNGPARMTQPVTVAPSSVTIIDREIIELTGAQTWADVFRLVPGIQPYSINGNRHGISYHGLGREFPNHMEVMVDGRSVYDPLFASVEWSGLGIDLRDIDYIEIVRGPNAPSYGSNAFLGAINIITRQPVQDRGVALRTTYGSLNTQNGSLRYNNAWGDLNYRISAGYRHNDGFPAVEAGPMDDGQELFQTEFRGTYTPNANDNVELHFGYTRYQDGYGDPDHPDEYTPANFNTGYQSIKWQRNLTQSSNLQLYVYHYGLRGENNVPLGQLSELMSAELDIETDAALDILNDLGVSDGFITHGFREVFSERLDLELEHSVTISPELRGTWGLGIRDEAINAEALLNTFDRLDQMNYRLFGHLEWRPNPHWAFNTGAMIEKNGLVDVISSPRIAVNYLFNNNHSVRFTLARGNRSPSLLEASEFHLDQHDSLILNAIRRTAPGLSQEKLDSYEFGYVVNIPQRGISLDIRAYHESIRDGYEEYQEVVTESPFFADLLVLQDNRVAVRENIADWTMKGVELQLRYQPNASTLVMGYLAHNSLRGTVFRNRHSSADPFSIDNSAPDNTGGLLISHRLYENLTSSMTMLYEDKVRWRDSGKQLLDSVTRIDARIGYDFSIGKTRGTVALVGQNIGQTYADYHINNRFASRYYLQLELELP